MHGKVLGCAVYVGGWRKDVQRFLERHESNLAELPLWVFSSGPTGEGAPEDLLEGWTFPERLKAKLDAIVQEGTLEPRTVGA